MAWNEYFNTTRTHLNAMSTPTNTVQNTVGLCGLAMAVASLASMFLLEYGVFFWLTSFLAVPALVTSLFGLRYTPKRIAQWGCWVALFACLHLPTITFSLLRTTPLATRTTLLTHKCAWILSPDSGHLDRAAARSSAGSGHRSLANRVTCTSEGTLRVGFWELTKWGTLEAWLQ